MILAHKIQLDPTEKQKEYFRKAAGCARFVWNWAIAEWDRQYKEGKKPKESELRKQFNKVKYQEFPWMKEIHRDAHMVPFLNLQKAFQRWWKGIAKYPKFKKKGKCRDSFYIANSEFWILGKIARLPRIGKVRLTQELRFQGKIMGAAVSRTADKWFISVKVDVGDYKKERTDDRVSGVDLGLTHVATLSNGLKFEAPKPLKKNLKKLKRLQRRLSRKKKGSKNLEKAKIKLARLHAKIANIRKDFTHKLTTCLCKNHAGLVIEDLSTKFMLKNRKLAKAASDASLYEIRLQLEYKSQIYGTTLVIADRWFPSSKKCFSCGNIKKSLSLSDRKYICDCGWECDRDCNAALNLKRLYTVGSTGIHACGPEGSGGSTCRTTKPCRDEAGTTQLSKVAQ